MDVLRLANVFLVLHIIFVCVNPIHVYGNCPPPTPPPVQPPTSLPVKPPTSLPVKPPMSPPTSPPVKPPTPPPVKPLTSAPTSPPVKPPMSPPTSPPVKPPRQPPVNPPTSPPVKPPTSTPTSPPVKPPMSPPTSPPVKPPTLPPVKPPMSPPTSPPVKPPRQPPVNPPTSPPVKPPTSTPTSPPVQPPTPLPVDPPPRNGVVVRGVVFCRSVCNYREKYNKVTRTALQGAAVVKLVCNINSMRGSFMRKAETDESGNFSLTTTKLKADGVKNCRLFLVRSRDRECNVPSTLNGGSSGAALTPAVEGHSVFNAGPFAFEPAKIMPCYD